MRQFQQHPAHLLSVHSRWESDRQPLTADLRFHLLFQMTTAFHQCVCGSRRGWKYWSVLSPCRSDFRQLFKPPSRCTIDPAVAPPPTPVAHLLTELSRPSPAANRRAILVTINVSFP